MIKCYIRKIQQPNCFKNVKLILSPTKLDICFSDQSFSIVKTDILCYNITGKNIHLELVGERKNLNIVITPYKKRFVDIIEQHIKKYFADNIVMVINPLFS